MTPLETALILSYLHSDQLIKNLDTVLIEMKALNDPRAGKFQSLLEKLRGASKRAFENVEKNIQDKKALEDDLWEMIGQNWDAIKTKNTQTT
jgi:pyruvate-formate lyase-activating enzyme